MIITAIVSISVTIFCFQTKVRAPFPFPLTAIHRHTRSHMHKDIQTQKDTCKYHIHQIHKLQAPLTYVHAHTDILTYNTHRHPHPILPTHTPDLTLPPCCLGMAFRAVPDSCSFPAGGFHFLHRPFLCPGHRDDGDRHCHCHCPGLQIRECPRELGSALLGFRADWQWNGGMEELEDNPCCSPLGLSP